MWFRCGASRAGVRRAGDPSVFSVGFGGRHRKIFERACERCDDASTPGTSLKSSATFALSPTKTPSSALARAQVRRDRRRSRRGSLVGRARLKTRREGRDAMRARLRVPADAGRPLGRQVRFGTTVRHSIPYKVLCARGWKEVDDDSWDFFYADVGWIHENVPYASTGSQGLRLSEHQRVNHFPNHVELTRKDLMAKNVKRSLKGAAKNGEDPAEYDFIPTTFILPNEGAMMLRHFRENGGMWIMKPIGRAQGKGIFLASKPAQIEAWIDPGRKRRRTALRELRRAAVPGQPVFGGGQEVRHAPLRGVLVDNPQGCTSTARGSRSSATSYS